jgi:hypothetical protein
VQYDTNLMQYGTGTNVNKGEKQLQQQRPQQAGASTGPAHNASPILPNQ